MCESRGSRPSLKHTKFNGAFLPFLVVYLSFFHFHVLFSASSVLSFVTAFMTRRPLALLGPQHPIYYITACPIHHPSTSSLVPVHHTIIGL
jgi:hypothetical protein